MTIHPINDIKAWFRQFAQQSTGGFRIHDADQKTPGIQPSAEAVAAFTRSDVSDDERRAILRLVDTDSRSGLILAAPQVSKRVWEPFVLPPGPLHLETLQPESAKLRHLAALMSKRAYPPLAIDNTAKRATHGFQDFEARGFTVTPFHGESTQAYLVVKDSTAFLTFRGTEKRDLEQCIRDTALDLHYWEQVPWENGGKVHAGFAGGLAQVWTKIEQHLHKTAADSPIQLHVSGHSLGGALALLAGAKIASLQSNNIRLASVYTFGAPNVFDSTGADAFESLLKGRVHCVAHESDIVPALPPPQARSRLAQAAAKRLGKLYPAYHPVGIRTAFDTNYKCCEHNPDVVGILKSLAQEAIADREGGLAKLAKQALGDADKEAVKRAIQAHSMDGYVRFAYANRDG